MVRLRPPFRRLVFAAVALSAAALLPTACARSDFSEGVVLALESDFDVDDPRYKLYYRLDRDGVIAEKFSFSLVQTCQRLTGPAQNFDGTPCLDGRPYRVFPGTFGVGPSGKEGDAARGVIATMRLALYDAVAKEPLVWKAVTFELPKNGTKVLRVPFSALDLGSAVLSPSSSPSSLTIEDQGVQMQLSCAEVLDARSIALEGARGSIAGACTQAIASGDVLQALPDATPETLRNSGTCFDSGRCAQGGTPVVIAVDAASGGDCIGTPAAPLVAGAFNVFYRPDAADAPIFQRKGLGGADSFLLRPFRASDGPLAYGWTLRPDGKLRLPRALCGGAPEAVTSHPAPFQVSVSSACATRASEVPVCPGAGPR
jgi:hypothetical protein